MKETCCKYKTLIFAYMITIQGLYDGVNITTTQKIPFSNTSKVEITFFEEMERNKDEEMHHYISNTIFDFWGNERDECEVNNINEK
jgi:hypothetical protein